jgi:hypothetical protein
VLFGSVPIIVMAYYLTFSGSGMVSRSGFPFVEYLTLANLLILLFTLFWSYRYTRLARQILDPEHRPSEESVQDTIWVGVIAGGAGILFSMVVLLLEAGSMLFAFLKAPQGGIGVIQTEPGRAVFVSAVDMVSLMALILILFAELLVLVLSLWLLFRTSLGSPEFPQPADADSGPPDVRFQAPR